MNCLLAALQHVTRCDVANRAVESLLIVRVHKFRCDSFGILKIQWRFLTYALVLERPMVTLQLAVALRVISV